MTKIAETQPNVDRILVALDNSPQGQAALRTAAQLAAQLQGELEGVFVEDDNLLRLCDLPFCQEVGLFSATPRPLDSRSVERQLRGLATSLRQSLAQVAGAMHIPWSFRVARGCVADELLAAAENAFLLTLSHHEQAFASPVGITAQLVAQRSTRPLLILGKANQLVRPFTLVYTASESASRALHFATRLVRSGNQPLQIWLQANVAEREAQAAQVAQWLVKQGVQSYSIRSGDAPSLQSLVQTQSTGTVILPAEHISWLARFSGPVFVVP